MGLEATNHDEGLGEVIEGIKVLIAKIDSRMGYLSKASQDTLNLIAFW